MRKVALLSCGKTKQTRRVAAKEMYTSVLFKKARAWAEKNCDEWYVLSAKYGLLHPRTEITPYDMTMKSMKSDERKKWGWRVLCQMKEKRLLRSGMRIVWLAGRDYIQPLQQLLADYPQVDILKGLRFGERLAKLNRGDLDRRLEKVPKVLSCSWVPI